MLNGPRKRPFENIVGKGENTGNQHFLLFPQCFLPYRPKNNHVIWATCECHLKNVQFGQVYIFGAL